jgi:hypothetical protein
MYQWLDWVKLLSAKELFTCTETSPLLVKGWKVSAYVWRTGPFAGRDLHRTTPITIMGLGFSGSIPIPFNHLLRLSMGCREIVLAQILQNWTLLMYKCFQVHKHHFHQYFSSWNAVNFLPFMLDLCTLHYILNCFHVSWIHVVSINIKREYSRPAMNNNMQQCIL